MALQFRRQSPTPFKNMTLSEKIMHIIGLVLVFVILSGLIYACFFIDTPDYRKDCKDKGGSFLEERCYTVKDGELVILKQ